MVPVFVTEEAAMDSAGPLALIDPELFSDVVALIENVEPAVAVMLPLLVRVPAAIDGPAPEFAKIVPEFVNVPVADRFTAPEMPPAGTFAAATAKLLPLPGLYALPVLATCKVWLAGEL